MLLVCQDHTVRIGKNMLRQYKSYAMLFQVQSILVVVPLKCGLVDGLDDNLLAVPKQYKYMVE